MLAQPSRSRVLPWRRRNLPRTLASCVIFSLVFSYIAHRARSRSPSARITQERRLKPLCGVITTILEVNEAVVNFVKKDRDVSLVVIGDHKTNHDEWRAFQDKYRDVVVYLSPVDQQSLPFSALRHVPWNHFGRKSVGFLYAIAGGCEKIYDFDDDNHLRSPEGFDKVSSWKRYELKATRKTRTCLIRIHSSSPRMGLLFGRGGFHCSSYKMKTHIAFRLNLSPLMTQMVTTLRV